MALPTQKVELQFGASSWVDVTSYAGNIMVNRGTTRVMDDYQAGTLQVDFTNNDRSFDPLNTASTALLYYTAGGYTMVQPGAKVRVTSNSNIIFYGWVQDWDFSFDSAGLDGNASITAGDLMYYMSRINFTGGTQGAGKFTGDRISDILTLNNLPTGSVTARNNKTVVGGDSQSPGDNVMTYLQQVARSEPGDLFASAGSSATMVFRDRTFTDYTWSSSYRQNVMKYPVTATTNSGTSAATYNGYFTPLTFGATPVIGIGAQYPYGTGVVFSNGTGGLTPSIQYIDVNGSAINPTGTATKYVVSGYFAGRGVTSANVFNYSAGLLDANGGTITSATVTASTVTGLLFNQWNRFSVALTASTGVVAGVSMLGVSGATGITENLYGAYFMAEPGTVLGSYFDGAYKPVASSYGVKNEVAFMGTAYASPSVYASNTASATATPATYITFADANSQGASYGNGTGIPFTSLQLANSGLTLYNQVQIVGTNATATATDTAGTALYGLKTYSQTDNLTTSLSRPAEIASDVLGMWRLPEYRASEFTVALHALTTAQQNLILGLELRDIIRLCFQPSAIGSVVDKYYQILSIHHQANPEKHEITFMVASMTNVPMRLDSTLTNKLNTSILG